jgi:HPr kinase/phosphorylase
LSENSLTVFSLVQLTKHRFGFAVLAGNKGLSNPIRTYELQRPGLVLSGFTDHFSKNRIQIIGQYEMHYLNSLDPEALLFAFNNLMNFPIPCIVFAKNLTPSDLILNWQMKEVFRFLLPKREHTA